MNPADPAFVYMALVLPSLFALTLIIEGLHKLLRNEPGWISLFFGLTFLGLVIGAYFFYLK